MTEAHVPTLAPEVLLQWGPLTITNTIINAWLAFFIFLVVGLALRKRLSVRPGKFQNGVEYFLEILLGYFDQVTGNRALTLRFLPVAGSVFFFILLSNWLGLLPGTGSITFGHSFLLRPATTDLNLTLAMALVTVISSHLFGFFTVGIFTHFNKFIQIGSVLKSLRKGPIAIFTALVEFAVGLIEIVGELSKVLSLSLRLFGNIFAGEVLLTVITGLVAAVIPTPFMLLELLVGMIQAGVFAILTIVYMTVASAEPHQVEDH